MDIQVYIMNSDFTVSQHSVNVPVDSTVLDVLDVLLAHQYIESTEYYTCSVFGDRVKVDYVLHSDDRLELSLPLPSDPIQRRRNLALKRKNR